MKILITGATGLIGKQLKNKLCHFYSDFDIFYLTKNKSINNKNTFYLDIINSSETEINEIFKTIKPDLFFHLAWETSHSTYLTSNENILWEIKTIEMLKCFYKHGGRKFIGLGSCIEYDWNTNMPLIENKSLLNGNNYIYGTSKLNIYKYLKNLNNVEYTWNRIFFVFGPGQSNSRLIPQLVRNAFNNENKLEINLNSSRNYISSFEIANQILMMAKSTYVGPVNICSEFSIKLSQLVDHISFVTNKNINVTFNESDRFSIYKEINGSINTIKKVYPNYTYNTTELFKDLDITIKDIINTFNT